MGTAEFNWSGGTLAITGAGGLTLDGGLLGPVIGIHTGKGLSVTADMTVNSGVTLAITGGTFSTDTLTVTGTAQLQSGTVTIRDTFAVNAGGELEIGGQDLVLLSTPTLQGELVLDQTTLSAPSMTVASGASLDLDSGKISTSGTFTNTNVVRMGNSGPATIRADTLNNSGALLGQGTIQAAVTNSGNVALSGDSSFTEDVTNLSGGAIIVSGGSAATFFEDVDNQTGAQVRVSQGCTATYFGDVIGGGSFTGSGTSYIEGDMRPGDSPGTMAFGGDVVFGNLAGLEIELGGTTAGSEFDQVDITGAAWLDGALDVQLINLGGGVFEPVAGNSFEILAATGGVNGTFAIEDLPPLADGLFWHADYSTTLLTLDVLRWGDMNGDNQVNDGDVQPFIDRLLNGPYRLEADMNGDGVLDGRDCAAFVAAVQAASSSTQAVPEPATVWLGAIALLGLVACDWRRRQRAG